VQPHCHQHAVIGFDVEERLLRRTGMDIELPDAGCCGMAGSFGYERGEKYRVSMRAGERVLLPAVRRASKDTLIVADGLSCRSQIEGVTRRRTLHLAEVLAVGIRQRAFEAELAGRAVRRQPVPAHTMIEILN
jgi:Fe-S oxidoreductase